MLARSRNTSLAIPNPVAAALNPIDTSGYPKSATFMGALLGGMVATLPAWLLTPRGTSPLSPDASWATALYSIGSIVGSALGARLLAPPDRKSRATIGGAIGGLFTPLGGAIGGAIGARKPDRRRNPRKKKGMRKSR